MKEWRTDAQKRATLQVVLAEIAKKENIRIDTEKLEREVKHIAEHYEEAEEQHIRMYVFGQMRNDAVFALLEGTADTDNAKKSSAETA